MPESVSPVATSRPAGSAESPSKGKPAIPGGCGGDSGSFSSLSAGVQGGLSAIWEGIKNFFISFHDALFHHPPECMITIERQDTPSSVGVTPKGISDFLKKWFPEEGERSADLHARHLQQDLVLLTAANEGLRKSLEACASAEEWGAYFSTRMGVLKEILKCH